MTSPTDPRPLVAHVVYSFHVGGLENGIVNLISRMDRRRWRHAVVALSTVSERFRQRIERGDVEYIALDKGPGHLHRYYPRLTKLFRDLRPAVVHTRNLAALEAAVPAAIAGVPVRIHGEHGWDVHDIDGVRQRYCWVRRLYRPFVHRYVALSKHIERYLVDRVGFSPAAVDQIYNGVDTQRFCPRATTASTAQDFPFQPGEHFIVGTVGRMQAVKDQLSLVEAFIRAVGTSSEAKRRLRLAVVGEGPIKKTAQQRLHDAGLAERAWLPGERADVPDVLRTFDLFALPSLSEGISNTILEAMATGLPVLATPVGGNAELVEDGVTGRMVPVGNVTQLSDTVLSYLQDPVRASADGRRGRARAEAHFSLSSMVQAYDGLYERMLAARGLVPGRLSEA